LFLLLFYLFFFGVFDFAEVLPFVDDDFAGAFLFGDDVAFFAGVFFAAAIFTAGDFPLGDGLFPFARPFLCPVCDKAMNLSTVQLTFSRAQNIGSHFAHF
jgi:hypothetical protein